MKRARGRSSLVLALLGAAACSRSADRDADPRALGAAAATRAAVHGRVFSGGEAEDRDAFPHVERYPWRANPTRLSPEEVDLAWLRVYERVLENENYRTPGDDDASRIAPILAGLRRLASEGDATGSPVLAAAERLAGFGREPDLLPLGASRESELEEFAVVGTGAIRLRHPETGDLAIDGGDAIVLVLVPGGTFIAGAQATDASAQGYDPAALTDEGPAREETVRTFFLAKTELTKAQAEILFKEPVDRSDWTTLARKPFTFTTSVTGVSADTALPTFRLRYPTEAEWEFAARAARAGTPPATPRTAGEHGLADVARSNASALGFFDLLDNVGEICAATDVRGLVVKAEYPVRGAPASAGRPLLARRFTEGTSSEVDVGLRVARDVTPPRPDESSKFDPSSVPNAAKQRPPNDGEQDGPKKKF